MLVNFLSVLGPFLANIFQHAVQWYNFKNKTVCATMFVLLVEH